MFQNFFRSMPPITRIQLFLSLGIAILLSTSYITVYDTYFSYDKIINSGQIWRLLTSLFCIKRINISFVFELMFMYHISINLELSAFKRGSVDYLYFLLLAAGSIYLLASVFTINYLREIFKHVLYYFFGRLNSEHLIIVHIIPIRAPYLIWFILLIDWIQDTADFKSTILSIAIGHTLYFLLKVYPNLKFSICKNAFDTPQFLQKINLMQRPLDCPTLQ